MSAHRVNQAFGYIQLLGSWAISLILNGYWLAVLSFCGGRGGGKLIRITLDRTSNSFGSAQLSRKVHWRPPPPNVFPFGTFHVYCFVCSFAVVAWALAQAIKLSYLVKLSKKWMLVRLNQSGTLLWLQFSRTSVEMTSWRREHFLQRALDPSADWFPSHHVGQSMELNSIEIVFPLLQLARANKLNFN